MDSILQQIDVGDLVHADRVHRSVYTDPAIFDLEMDRIFGRAWVYIGHDSEVPEFGDYVTRTMGKRPVIMCRHTDGEVYVIHNSCGHRGAKVCVEPRGNAQPFQCPYHGWTFKTNGDLEAVSMPRGYGESLDMSDPGLGMRQLPKVDNYRGFVFACLDEDAESLDTWLGPVRQSIDDIADRSPSGKVRLTAGIHRYVFRGNWKFQLENTVDMYHVPFSHESTLNRQGKQFSRRKGDDSGSSISDAGAAAKRWEQREAWGAAENGHSYTGHQPVADKKRDDPIYQSYVESLEGKHTPERLAEVLAPRRHNTAFYPNMSLQALNQHVRVIYPISVDRTEIMVWPVLFEGVPDEMNQDIIRGLNVTHSAASLIQTDDLENFHRCQEGANAENSEWVWFARGLDTDHKDNHGDIINTGTGELPQRAQFVAWARLMAP
ncbi:MAG: aromatic-ring-hydroxylating dioxygenase subunit alpha [Rhodospirillaceae bacterium]|nr:aromatic-ring-hydroxylating dioxygenase subunit alpha [Rhodospirillaceae bacterium]|tara:strand:- start:9025 stop:10323 length:1299 start_codon:yes stop_codon:yes gene_type:complete